MCLRLGTEVWAPRVSESTLGHPQEKGLWPLGVFYPKTLVFLNEVGVGGRYLLSDVKERGEMELLNFWAKPRKKTKETKY